MATKFHRLPPLAPIALPIALAVALSIAVWPGAAAPLAAQTVYVAFGDSITEGTGDVDDTGGYPIRLDELLQNATVRNRGVAGERTPEGLTRIDSVLDEGGDVLMLMEGTNDITRTEISNETTLFNLAEMARKVEASGLEAVHATLIPRLPTAKRDRDNFENQEMNQNIRDIAGNQQRRLVDNFEVFSVQPNLFASLYADRPTDPVGHPNPMGYDLMAATFRDVLTGRDRVPPVPGILDPNHGEVDVPATTSIRVDVWDFGAGLDVLSVDLFVDGQMVAADIVGSSSKATLSYAPPAPLSGLVRLSLRATDLASPANTFNREIARFRIGSAELQGDIDLDGRVDGLDLIRIAISFGLRSADRAYDPRADLNSDGIVDGVDLAIVASNFGRSL